MRGSADCLTVAEVPETRFAETPGGRIAYQVVGDGPIDVVVTHSPFSPIDLMWDEPSLVRFLDRLSTFSRHTSGPTPGGGAPRTRCPTWRSASPRQSWTTRWRYWTIWAGSRRPSLAT